MRFSWRAFLLAPLPITFLFSVMTTVSSPPLHPIISFLFFFIAISLFAYVVTGVLFVPGLLVASKLMRPTAVLAAVLGVVAGIVVYFPMAWLNYTSSGADSGPPEGTFGQWLWRTRYDWDNWIFPVSGLITALLYWWLARRESRRVEGAAAHTA